MADGARSRVIERVPIGPESAPRDVVCLSHIIPRGVVLGLQWHGRYCMNMRERAERPSHHHRPRGDD